MGSKRLVICNRPIALGQLISLPVPLISIYIVLLLSHSWAELCVKAKAIKHENEAFVQRISFRLVEISVVM